VQRPARLELVPVQKLLDNVAEGNGGEHRDHNRLCHPLCRRDITERRLQDVHSGGGCQQDQHDALEQRVVHIADACEHPHQPNDADHDLRGAPGDVKPRPVEQDVVGEGCRPEVVRADEQDERQAEHQPGGHIRAEVAPLQRRLVHRDEGPRQPEHGDGINKALDRRQQHVMREIALPRGQRGDHQRHPREQQRKRANREAQRAGSALAHPLAHADRDGGLQRKQDNDMVDEAARRLADEV